MAANGQKDNDLISRPASLHLEINLTLEIGQVLLSLLHAWGKNYLYFYTLSN